MSLSLNHLRIVLNTPWRQALFALCCGLLTSLGFDFPFDSAWRWLAPVFACVGLFGVMWLVSANGVRRHFWLGYAFGLGLFGYGLNWVYISMYLFGGANAVFSIGANVVLVLFLSLYWGVTLWLTDKLSQSRYFKAKQDANSPYKLYLFAIVVGFFEWLRSVLFIGFPWLSIGYAFVDTPLAQWAKLTGVFGVSVFVVLALAIVMNFVQKKCMKPIIVWSLLLVASLAFVALRATTSPSGKPLQVALMQGNISVITKFDPKFMDESITRYFQLTDEAFDPELDLVVWPETAIPYFYNDARLWLDAMFQMQAIGGFDFITGIPEGDIAMNQYYNAIVLQSQQPAPQTFYLKSHLLPFGEYLPFRSIFAFFEDFVELPMNDFSRGGNDQPLFVVRGVKIAPSICFEAVFGDEIRLSANSAELLVNLSNDGWFGQSKAQAQHLNVQRLRAIENGKPMIRSTNDGITAIIDHNGNVTAAIPQYQPGILRGQVTPYSGKTLYSRYGDWTLWCLLGIMMGLCAMFARFRQANQPKTE